jgi:kinesin family protein C2/C3
MKLFVVPAASAVEGQVKEKSRLCHFVNELSEKFKVFC